MSSTSSAAPVRDGKAVAFVQHFPGKKAGAKKGEPPSSGRYALTLRADGEMVGTTKAKIVAGHGRKVRIPISRTLRAKVKKKGHVKVSATLKRIDGKPGSGEECWFDLYRAVRGAGKGLWVSLEGYEPDVAVEKADRIVKTLGPDGFYFQLPPMDQKQADAVLSKADREWKTGK